jgi:hypothetical protein
VSEIITPALVSLDESLGTDKRAVIDALAARVAATGRATMPQPSPPTPGSASRPTRPAFRAASRSRTRRAQRCARRRSRSRV